MTDKQPTALRLADLLDNFADRHARTDLDAEMCWDSADELRRLHEDNNLLHLANVDCMAHWEAAMRERCMLLEALEDLYAEQNGAPLIRRQDEWQTAMNKARAAIDAAKENS